MYSAGQIAAVLKKFQIDESDLQRIRKAGKLIKPIIPQLVHDFYDWMQAHKEYQLFFASNPKRLERVSSLQQRHWESFFEAQLDPSWFAMRVHIGTVHANIDLPNDIYIAGLSKIGGLMTEHLQNSKINAAERVAMMLSMNKLFFLETYVVMEEISRIGREKLSASSRALMEMATPVTPIWEGILLLPLLGVVDSSRTQDIMNKTLTEIERSRAKVFVLDISGVSAMDTAVSNQLLKITKATMLMGCETIISGISPSVARTLVELGVSIGEVRTTATLRDSFELALKAVGVNPDVLGD